MNAKVTIDQTGRILIPKSIRNQLHLRPGDKLMLASEDDAITLHKSESGATLVKENGMWVASSEGTQAVDIVDLIHRDREERSRHLLGMDKE